MQIVCQTHRKCQACMMILKLSRHFETYPLFIFSAPSRLYILQAMADDDPDEPRPLRDPCAPRREGSSIFGYYGNDAGRSFQTVSVAATFSKEDLAHRTFFEMDTQNESVVEQRGEDVTLHHNVHATNAERVSPRCSELSASSQTSAEWVKLPASSAPSRSNSTMSQASEKWVTLG